MARKSQQSLENEPVSTTLPPMPGRPVRVTKLRDAQRLLSRLITEFQIGNIDSRWAKDLCYLLSTFVQVTKDAEIEARMTELEHRFEKITSAQRRY